ncbi:MAG TPA: PAS domain-containing protein, partial [Planctomycetes bacterium]|nr:PAS domain-containing protein [Planctomycetota bacterium]
ILDALPDGVVVINAADQVICVNPAAERILGRSAEEILGRSRRAVVGPTGDPLLAGVLEGRTRGRVEREVTTLDGSVRHIAYTSAPLPAGCELQVLTDRTVASRLRQQVNRLDTLAALGEMAAGVAHEIRNPLNGIDGFAALLGRELVSEGRNEDVSRYAARIRRGVSEINAIVSNLLGFAAPQGLQNGRVDLHHLLSSVCAEAQEFAPKDVSIHFHSEAGVASEVEGDTVKLRVVFLNLIRNAVEAVHEDGTVQVDLEADHGKLIIRVRDDGPGLAPAMRLKLFRPFSTTKAQGTGLGLAIAHKVCALHGGTIEHEESEHGCTFRVELPAAIEEANE